MKKYLIFIVIIGFVFVTGCIDGEEANNSQPESNLQSTDAIGLNNILEGYHSNDDTKFKTYAIPEEEPFEVKPKLNNSHFTQDNEYEGVIPFGKKRIATTFQLINEEKNIIITVLILESGSDSTLKKFLNDVEIQFDQSELKKDIIADYSFQYSEASGVYPGSILMFSNKNNFISIEADSIKTGISKENIEEETFKVAKAVNNKIIDGTVPTFQLQEQISIKNLPLK